MKRLIFFLLLLPMVAAAQIKNVIVENYYISDDYDSTDTTASPALEAGSKTYRIYVDLETGYKIKQMYGDSAHSLKISSTANFYNNLDRPTAYFGYLINKSWFPSNPLMSLDSWLTLGEAAKTFSGVLKVNDSNGSIIGGTKNYGGSAGIASGLLNNADTAAGIPLTVADGMVPDTMLLGQWSDNGFKDATQTDTTVFGAVKSGSEFISNNAYLQQNLGVRGIDPANNKVLVGQLTTKGSLSFELNLEVIDSLGNSVFYVAAGQDRDLKNSSGAIIKKERISPYLKYPAECGCRDPRYIEYSKNFSCDDPSACNHPVVFGCTDSMACNYNPNANFSVPSLCCYPGYCNDRDLAIVCPALKTNGGLYVYPNPADDQCRVKVNDPNVENATLNIYNFRGEKVLNRELTSDGNKIEELVNLSGFNPGVYMVQLSCNGKIYDSKILIKN